MSIIPVTPTTMTVEIGGRTLSIEHGLLAELAQGSVMVRYGDSMVLSAASGRREVSHLDFFPLTVDFEERMYAAGKIPGGFIKREGRPTEAAILAARLTDRPLRPLFPKGYRSEVQIINTVMAADQENDPDILGIIGASTALTISQIPWDGPVGACRIGYLDGQLVINPTYAQREQSRLDMVVAGTEDAIMMVEGEAGEISEEIMLDAIVTAHEQIRRITAAQLELREKVGAEKWEFVAPATDTNLVEGVRSFLGSRLSESLNSPDKVMRMEGTNELEAEVVAKFAGGADATTPEYTSKQVKDAFDSLLKAEVRGAILSDGARPDGRTPSEVRPIWSMVGYLPRVHGSAIFTRGQTQVISVVTVGTGDDAQRLDSINPVTEKRYIHHYNFPPFSVGEVRPMRGPSRRDQGHGALAERAMYAVLPSDDDFPYTLRVVSDVVSSNGSTSMASVCGSSMALMDAGVPIVKPVAGVAMGLISEPESGRYTVLTDIQGIEDHLGDMDFKVAGTADGVTAIQMDIKVKGITPEIMREALAQAHDGRLHILGKMAETISESRAEMSQFAPRTTKIKIDTAKIGAVIGPGGKMIRALQEETGTRIEIEDDGTVSVSSTDPAGTALAIQKIQGLTQEIKVERGEIYTGKIVGIQPFGAFVELLPGKDGLVHISELSDDPAVRVNKVEDLFNLGDTLTVMVTDVAPNGKVSLSRRAAVTGELPPPKADGPRGPRRDDRGPRRDDDRGPRRDFGGGGRDGGGESGPRREFDAPREGGFRQAAPREGGFREAPPREGGFREAAPRDSGPREGNGPDRAPRPSWREREGGE